MLAFWRCALLTRHRVLVLREKRKTCDWSQVTEDWLNWKRAGALRRKPSAQKAPIYLNKFNFFLKSFSACFLTHLGFRRIFCAKENWVNGRKEGSKVVLCMQRRWMWRVATSPRAAIYSFVSKRRLMWMRGRVLLDAHACVFLSVLQSRVSFTIHVCLTFHGLVHAHFSLIAERRLTFPVEAAWTLMPL